ncbi:MAG TPA: DUF72 domain-containing protein [Caulobacteraceae bacterium]|jgi:uncharacterized protein YecE (DUF72 family)|nr:DUF72 domain-containing protein [Caulobacteraceae bacterium]
MDRIHIGTSGWTYDDWKGPFYPAGLKAKGRFGFYASQFDTTEINGSFYRLPSETAVAAWAAAAPPGFVFAWKASRFITHNKKLKDVADSIALVFRRMDPLGEHFGPVLFQLPPQLHLDRERLARFLDLLPPRRRCTVEFRHPSWYAAPVFDLLRDHDTALCISDHHAAPSPWEQTASFLYVRGHGPGGRYVGRYPDQTLDDWAGRIAAFEGSAFAYFDNDIKAAAPEDARRLLSRVRRAAKA